MEKFYMNELQERIDNMCTLLYQENVEQGYDEVQRILPLILQQVEQIEDTGRQQELIQYLQEALAAMENNEWTLLADLFLYEIAERVKG